MAGQVAVEQPCYLVGALVGHVEVPLPVVAELYDCSRCRRPMWLTRTSIDELRDRGWTPVAICPECLSPDLEPA